MTYARLEQHFQRVSQLQHAIAILQWDEAVVMPPSAGAGRAESVAGLGVMVHELLDDPRVEDWSHQADSESLGEWQRANVREIRRICRRARCLSPRLVEASTVAELRCEQAWRRQRAENDWAGFAPLLEEVVALKRETAQALAGALGVSPYDALIDEYEPGAKAADMGQLFAELGAFLPRFTAEVVERQRQKPALRPRGPFPVSAQRQLAVRLMEATGFDASRGRLDVSHHPFCGGVPSDVRITTRYDEADFATSLMGVLHEAGHGKYEQGLPTRWASQPVGQPRGMSAHEGQSLLQEMQICRGWEFLQFAAPIMFAELGESARDQPAAFSAENLFALATRVEPGLIRVDADEVTYPSHVILRFEIEQRLIAGTLAVRDIPELWNTKMVELLGIDPGKNFADGCMQDVHWPSGSFGYFPVYVLGAMTAAQLHAAMQREIPEGLASVARGDFSAINGWLESKIWSQASLHTPEGLMLAATGEALSARYSREHLERRYGNAH